MGLFFNICVQKSILRFLPCKIFSLEWYLQKILSQRLNIKVFILLVYIKVYYKAVSSWKAQVPQHSRHSHILQMQSRHKLDFICIVLWEDNYYKQNHQNKLDFPGKCWSSSIYDFAEKKCVSAQSQEKMKIGLWGFSID